MLSVRIRTFPTQFSLTVQSVTETAQAIRAFVLVTNTGDYSGKEVVQMYYSAPQGLLQKPARELSAFCKTRTLLPGESQLLTLETAKNSMASYDDLGKFLNPPTYWKRATTIFTSELPSGMSQRWIMS